MHCPDVTSGRMHAVAYATMHIALHVNKRKAVLPTSCWRSDWAVLLPRCALQPGRSRVLDALTPTNLSGHIFTISLRYRYTWSPRLWQMSDQQHPGNKPRTTPVSSIAHFRTLDTTPAPTVRPPSRMANRRPASMATGVISSKLPRKLSPGMTMGVSSGSLTTPACSQGSGAS